MIAEIDTLSIPEEKKELITKRIKKIRDSNSLVTPQIIKSFREKAASFINYNLNTTNMTNEQKIEHTLKTFGIIVRVSHKLAGYSSDTYLIEFSAGTKINSIYSHRLDIANALDVRNVRISKDLIPYEGKSYLGIEVSKKREKILPFDPARITGKKIPLGEDNFGNTIIWDLENHSTPHMLVCGGTGSGKSVFLKTIIKYATNVVDEVVIMDTKRDFVGYNDIEEIEEKMRALVQEMESIIKEKRKKTTLLIFDEFADALANSKKGAELKLYEDVTEVTTRGTRTKRIHVGELKSLEENLRILAQKGRSAGFRIVIATQRASTKVITGDAKVNFPVQVCFKVQKEIDSKVVLDESGAELLTGHGDGLIKSPEYMETIRFQSFYTE